MANPNEPRKEPPGLPKPPAEGPVAAQSASGPWKVLIVVAILIAVVTAGILFARRKGQAGAAGKSGPAGRGALGPVAVVVGTVTNKQVPIYLDGLGTVQAFNTVTVRSRVDGQLQKLGFVEGQEVHAGDMLAQIDPSPFEAQVAQNEAKKAQEEAQLAHARGDLKRADELFA